MASVADTGPNVYVPWLLSPFIAAKSSVCLNLDTCFISVNDIFKPHPKDTRTGELKQSSLRERGHTIKLGTGKTDANNTQERQ